MPPPAPNGPPSPATPAGERLCSEPRRHLDRLRQRRPHPQDLGRRHRRRTGHPQGHTGTVSGCAVSPDGTWIVSASGTDTLKIWDAATGAERATLTGHTSRCEACAVSPDGTWIVSASGTHPQDLGCRHRRRTGHPHRPHRQGARLCGEPRRHLDRLRQQRQHPQDLGRRHRRRTGHPHRPHRRRCTVVR